MFRRTFTNLFAVASSFCVFPGYAEAPLDPTAFRGRVLYVDFWASCCTPCRQSFPWMQSLQDACESARLSVVAVNLDRNRHDAENFLARRFKVHGMPTNLLIDRHGVLRDSHIGFQPADRATYEAQLREVLAEK